jgi:hypothetical protein
MKKKEKTTVIFAFTTSTLDRGRIVLVYRLNFSQMFSKSFLVHGEFTNLQSMYMLVN